jgi:hypothetical protein
MTGIYQIRSKIKPDRIYIGSTSNINGRKSAHLHRLKNNCHHSKKLQRHYNKYGKEDLCFSIILLCSKNDLLSQEQKFIDTHIPYFNECKIAGSTRGLKPSEESNAKRRAAFKDRVYTTEQMAQFGHFAGKSHTEKTKMKISLGNKGKILSEETKRKLSAAKMGKSYNKGHLVTDETRKKISQSNKGRASWNRGLPAWNKGKKNVYSEDTRTKMSEARKAWHLKQKATVIQ